MMKTQHILKDDFVRLCKATDVVEGLPLLIEIEAFPKLVAYKINDDYFVTNNECTHGRGSLSEGFQEGATIECPLHGGAFDIRTGAATVFPCKVPVQTYPVEIIEGWISISSTLSGGAK